MACTNSAAARSDAQPQVLELGQDLLPLLVLELVRDPLLLLARPL